MEMPHPGGTDLVITVIPTPGKYECTCPDSCSDAFDEIMNTSIQDLSLKVERAEDPLLYEDRHHPALSTTMVTTLPSPVTSPQELLDFRRC
ncbi:hypothetical protein J6590_041470 [Homalodisca vitripennis]|nr:hypothetical protein J6590_041470 [Homalodisca vitripennis]